MAGATALFLGSCAPPVALAPVKAPPQPAAIAPAPVLSERADFTLIGEPRQGGILRGVAPTGTVGLNLDGQAIGIDTDGQFLVAFDRDAPASARLEARLADGSLVARHLSVMPGQWPLEHVNASPTGSVTSAEFRTRRESELAVIAAARETNVEASGWRQKFLWPARGRISGQFGAQRIYRGQPGSYHSGVDVAIGTGTPFYAPADGVVVLAASEPFTLEGLLLIVDHGMGLSSAFLHCSRLDVRAGDRVRQGQQLGAAGGTGRASGPHLHWGMKWNAARIDPALLAGPMTQAISPQQP
jgi:hypothetical protein